MSNDGTGSVRNALPDGVASDADAAAAVGTLFVDIVLSNWISFQFRTIEEILCSQAKNLWQDQQQNNNL